MLKYFFLICCWPFWKWVLLEYNLHTLNVLNWVHLWVLINVYNCINYHHSPDMKHFSYRQKFLLAHSPPSPGNRFVFLLCFLSLQISFAFANNWYKWNYIVHTLFCLASFTQHNVSETCPCYCVYHVLFYCWLECHFTGGITFVYPFTCWWIFGLFLVWGNYE